jgi:hypothetical protein
MKKIWMAAAAALGFAASAHAVPVTTGGFTYEFVDFSGAGAIAPLPGCGQVGPDYRCNEMHVGAGLGGDLEVTASRGAADALVYQNLPQWDGGLGVVPVTDPNNGKSIGSGEVLKLSFENAVNLVGYHVYQVGNAPGADHFQVSADHGGTWETRSFARVVFTQWYSDKWLTGHDFWFRSEDSERFYLGAAKITTAVPEPASVALLLAGLGMVGLATRRRRQGA